MSKKPVISYGKDFEPIEVQLREQGFTLEGVKYNFQEKLDMARAILKGGFFASGEYPRVIKRIIKEAEKMAKPLAGRGSVDSTMVPDVAEKVLNERELLILSLRHGQGMTYKSVGEIAGVWVFDCIE